MKKINEKDASHQKNTKNCWNRNKQKKIIKNGKSKIQENQTTAMNNFLLLLSYMEKLILITSFENIVGKNI